MKSKILAGMVAMALAGGAFASPVSHVDSDSRVIGDPSVPIEIKVEGVGFDAKMLALRVRGLGGNNCENAGGVPLHASAITRGCTYPDGGYVRIDESVQAGVAVVTVEPSGMANLANFSEWISARNAEAESIGDGAIILRKSKH